MTYDELRRVASRLLDREGATRLSTADVVHEVWIRLSSQTSSTIRDREHFVAIAALAMRRYLVDEARRRKAAKRNAIVVPIDDLHDALGSPRQDVNVLDLDDALSQLESTEPELSEVLLLRCFAGLTLDETASTLGTTTGAAGARWRKAKRRLAELLA